jgi:very-long-chain ceramide synthase
MYGKGKADMAFVAFYTIVLSFTREFLMQRVIRPWAVRCGIRGRAKQSRFMEQVYTAMYFGVFGQFGLYIMSRGSLWYFNTRAMFEGFPHRAHEGMFKAYYLLQASYWSQQAIVLLLQLEKPRKDFKELALIGLSYRFHFAMMGIAVYITHDISDFFLAVSQPRPQRPLRSMIHALSLTRSHRPPKPSTTSTPPLSAPTSASSSSSGSTCATTST